MSTPVLTIENSLVSKTHKGPTFVELTVWGWWRETNSKQLEMPRRLQSVSDGCYEGVNHIVEIVRQENGDAAYDRLRSSLSE